MKKVLFLALVILGIVLSGCGNTTLQDSKIDTPKTEIAKSENPAALKYENPVWHYSYNYPSIFVTFEQDSGNKETFYNSTKDASLTTYWINMEGMQPTLDEELSTEEQEHKTITIIDRQSNLAPNKPGLGTISYLILTWQDDDMMGNAKFISQGDSIWSIEMQYPSNQKDVYQPYFNTVINSFKLND